VMRTISATSNMGKSKMMKANSDRHKSKKRFIIYPF